MRSRAFHRKRDAERYDLTIKTAKQTGTLAATRRRHRDARRIRREHLGADPRRGARPKTIALYAGLYDGHVSPALGGYPLRELTPEVIGRWQADRLAAGARSSRPARR